MVLKHLSAKSVAASRRLPARVSSTKPTFSYLANPAEIADALNILAMAPFDATNFGYAFADAFFRQSMKSEPSKSTAAPNALIQLVTTCN